MALNKSIDKVAQEKIIRFLSAAALLAGCFLVGCTAQESLPPGVTRSSQATNSSTGAGSESVSEEEEEVGVLGFAYHYYHDSFKKGPATIADLEKGNLKPGKLKELHGDQYEVNPGIEFASLGDKAQTTWLVRRKDASTNGGYVFMADGRTKKMTADEVSKLQ
jgi:hypothetical protein